MPEFTTDRLWERPELEFRPRMIVIRIAPSLGLTYRAARVVRWADPVGGLPRVMADHVLIEAMERYAHAQGDGDEMNCWMDEGEGMSCRIR